VKGALIALVSGIIDSIMTWQGTTESAEIAAAAALEAAKHPPAVAKMEKDAQAAVQLRFHARRLAAVKARILAATGAGVHLVDAPDALEFDRTGARELLDVVGRTEGLYFMGAPKGEGKSTLMSHVVASCPHAIYVDVDTGSPDKAIRAIAAAIGYDMRLDAEETAAAAASVALPDVKAPQGQSQFIDLMGVYEQACVELRAAGKLQAGRCPVLLLDHVTRPLKNPGGIALEGDNLLYDAILVGHRFANKHIASLAFISSDPLMQKQAWESASGRDSVRYVRVPEFTEAEATQLLERRIFRAQAADRRAALLQRAAARATHGGAPTTADVLAAVKDAYGDTVAFALAAVGKRARWLETLTGNKEEHVVVLTDAELRREAGPGMPVPALYRQYVEPASAAAGRVDPGVLAAFERLVDERVSKLGKVLDVPEDIAPEGDVTPADRSLLKRILATDAALHQMLRAAPAAVKYHDLRGAHFRGREADLLLLGAEHVVFYDHEHLALEFESELMRRVVAARLGSDQHTKTVALARALVELPALTKAATDAEEAAAKAAKAEVAAMTQYDWWKVNSGWSRSLEADVSNAEKAARQAIKESADASSASKKAQAAVTKQQTAIAELRREITQLSSRPQSAQPAAQMPPKVAAPA